MNRSDAFLFSVLVHGLLALLVWATGWRMERQRAAAADQAAVTQHAEAFRQTKAETQAGRLRRMRELIERMAAAETQSAEPSETPAQADAASAKPSDRAPEATSAAAPAPRDPAELWKQSRQDYEVAREKLIDLEARRLAQLTQTNTEQARAELEREAAKQQSGGGKAPGAGGEAEKAIGQMHDEVQGRLGRVLQQKRSENEGRPLAVEDARAAYTLTQTQQTAQESRAFDRVVDWTALMGKPLSTQAVNGILDPEGSLRQVVSGRERELQNRFHATSQAIRFTRRIGAPGAESAEWICPDAWYMIGPFDNERREAIDRSYPPEIEIDRDAVYAGKGGRAVSWAYVPVRSLEVIPPQPDEYAIYYAFTEIYCAEPTECWLALGSDDHSKLWVNDVLVWSDSKNLKEWSPTQGFRRIRLEQGFSRFLLRLENGWRGTQFSVAISLRG